MGRTVCAPSGQSLGSKGRGGGKEKRKAVKDKKNCLKKKKTKQGQDWPAVQAELWTFGF